MVRAGDGHGENARDLAKKWSNKSNKSKSGGSDGDSYSYSDMDTETHKGAVPSHRMLAPVNGYVNM